MNEVIPGLWIGDLPSALNVEKLKANNIFSILSAMRGRITVNETFIRHQILIDDTEDADILSHLLPSIHFIQAELDKGRGVLVHCQAGVSRSATIVAAYLMYSKDLDPEQALEQIRKTRPYIDPNPNFVQQLELFHKAHYHISKKEKDIRLYYLGRTVEEVMNGDGTISDLGMFASYPRTPATDSNPSTPVSTPHRRIRCKMCRQGLAAREHMLDHGQLGAATPASMTPAASRRPSEPFAQPAQVVAGNGIRQRRPSRPRLSFGSGVLGDSLAMSTIEHTAREKRTVEEPRNRSERDETRNISGADRLRNFRNVSRGLIDTSLTMSSAVADDEEEEEEDEKPLDHIHAEAAKLLGRRLSDAVITPVSESIKDAPAILTGNVQNTRISESSATDTDTTKAISQEPMTTHLISPVNLAAQLFANPKLAALRSPSFGSSSIPVSSPPTQPKLLVSAPIIVNPKCSGYFVEPMKWMELFLSEGHLSGKIVCPNKKCGAKLGNYDWAGVCCGCKQWVVPGFCISRSKVDEIVI